MANPPLKIRWAVFIGIALLALAVRLPQLSERPMHTDEAVNAYITGQLLAGEPFRYDSQDRHGPALFLVAEPLAKVLGAKNFAGLTESQLRLSTVLTGAATVLLVGAGVEMFGFMTCLVAALLMAFAPLPVYYSRYFIHETLFVAATLGLILAGGRALLNHAVLPAALAGFCAALMLACKETAVIHFFALGVAVLAGYWLNRRAAGLQASVGSGDLPNGGLPPDSAPATAGRTKAFFIAAGVFIFTVVLFFTWFGRNWAVFSDLLNAIPRFAARAGGEGHEKPFGYYFNLLDPLFILSLVAAAGVYAAICDAVGGIRKSSLMLVIYGLVLFLVYSAIPYKTPWLALNFWLPLAFICGLGVSAFWDLIKHPAGRWGVGIAGIILLMTLAAQTKEWVFDQPADEKNPYAYAHTGEDVLRLPGRLEQLAKAENIEAPVIAVVAADPWPLPWYLRKFSHVGFWQPGQEPSAADFYITGTDVSDPLAKRLENCRYEFFGVRPNVLIMLWTPAAPPVSP